MRKPLFKLWTCIPWIESQNSLKQNEIKFGKPHSRLQANSAHFRLYQISCSSTHCKHFLQTRCSSNMHAVPSATSYSLCPVLPFLPSLLGQLQLFSQAWISYPLFQEALPDSLRAESVAPLCPHGISVIILQPVAGLPAFTLTRGHV